MFHWKTKKPSIIEQRRTYNQNRKLKVLLISVHPPIESELMAKWLEMGHEVYKVSLSSEWHNEYFTLDERVVGMIPKSRPDVIICGNLTDTLVALTLKFFKRWFGAKISFIHWWFPPNNPLLYFVKNISVCEYERKYLKKMLWIESGVTYCPVDVNFFIALPVKKRKKVIAIGNRFKSRPVMGYDHLSRIIRLIHEKDPSIEIGVFGTNDPADFPDYVDSRPLKKEEMLKEINIASGVFFTTTRNLIMNSLQIAMSAESNVVAFDLEPFREIIEDGKSGYLIKLGDDTTFADKLVKVANGYNSDMGKLARENIVKKCESGLVAKQILELTLK